MAVEAVKRTERTMPQKIEISEKFGNINVININEKAFKCVDPRPLRYIPSEENALSILREHRNRKPIDYENSVAVPGGSLGFAMIVMGAFTDIKTEKTHITPQQAVDLVVKWHNKEGIQFSYHTDNHGHGFGCGHIRLASLEENQEVYGIKSKDVIMIRDYVAEKADRGKIEVTEAILEGPHINEKGVLLIKGDKTVEQADDKGNKFFRLDQTPLEENLESLALFIKENSNEIIGKKIDVTAEKLKEISKMQTNATLGLLAAGLPVYLINLRAEKQNVIQMGTIPQLPKRA